MNRPFPRLCATCRERAVQPVRFDAYTVTVDHDGHPYELVLSGVPATRCTVCQTLILDESVEDRIDDALRTAAGLLHPAEIMGRREALGLTRETVATALSVGPATLERWEVGDQMQSRAMDRFLRAYLDLPDLRTYLEGHPLPARLPEVDQPA